MPQVSRALAGSTAVDRQQRSLPVGTWPVGNTRATRAVGPVPTLVPRRPFI